MRITYVINDAKTGGAQTLLAEMGRTNAGHVHQELVVLLRKGPLSDRYEEVFDQVQYLGFDEHSRNLLRIRRVLASALEKSRPDVVHSHLLQSDLAVLGFHHKHSVHISTVHSTGYSRSDHLITRGISLVVALFSRNIDATIACSDGSMSYMRRLSYRSPVQTTIPNGVVMSRDRRKDSGTYVLSLARWHPMKDHRNLFRAFRHLLDRYPDLRLACAGQGMESTNRDLEQVLRDERVLLNTDLLGEVLNVREVLRGAKALAISSRYGESLPMVGLEAMAEGVLVASTDVGACEVLVAQERFLAPADAPRELADSIAGILELDHADYARFAEDMRLKCETEYSIVRTAQRHRDLYARVLGEAVV